jgi:hypothetical protein
MADVEMKDAKSKGEVKDAVAIPPPPLSPVSEIKSNVTLIERAVSTLEPRFTIRVLRSLTALRKRLDDKALCDAVCEVYPQGVYVACCEGFLFIFCRFTGQGFSALVASCCTCSGRIYGSGFRSFA